MPTVNIFSAGDHFHEGWRSGLNEATEMLTFLLSRSGYTKDFVWEARIDKLRHCSAESRPIRVIGYKPYGVILRVKPSPNATVDHQMTLQVPEGSGYSAENLFNQLKNSEKAVGRLIRQNKFIEKPIIQEEETPVIQEIQVPVVVEQEDQEAEEEQEEFVAEGERPNFKNLRGIARNRNKLHYVLGKVDKIEKTGFCHNKLQFIEALRDECKWSHDAHSMSAISRVLTELTKYEYVMEVYNERDKLIGWQLTDKGIHHLQFKGEIEQPTESEEVVQKEPEYNVMELLLKNKSKIQDLSDAANRLYANIVEKRNLENKLSMIEQENAELVKIINNSKEAYEILQRLDVVVSALPLRGVKE